MMVVIKITRQVLFEKFNIKHEMREFFVSHLDGCELHITDKYPGWIFYMKKVNGHEKPICLFQQETKNKWLYVHYDRIWSVFESQYRLNYTEIQLFTQNQIENLVKLEGYKTGFKVQGFKI